MRSGGSHFFLSIIVIPTKEGSNLRRSFLRQDDRRIVMLRNEASAPEIPPKFILSGVEMSE